MNRGVIKMSGVKKDCFAWNDRQWKCDVLNEIVCRHKDSCSFYATKEQHKLKQAKAELARLRH